MLLSYFIVHIDACTGLFLPSKVARCPTGSNSYSLHHSNYFSIVSGRQRFFCTHEDLTFRTFVPKKDSRAFMEMHLPKSNTPKDFRSITQSLNQFEQYYENSRFETPITLEEHQKNIAYFWISAHMPAIGRLNFCINPTQENYAEILGIAFFFMTKIYGPEVRRIATMGRENGAPIFDTLPQATSLEALYIEVPENDKPLLRQAEKHMRPSFASFDDAQGVHISPRQEIYQGKQFAIYNSPEGKKFCFCADVPLFNDPIDANSLFSDKK
ncbi:MAG: hypothetical protein H6850_01815 [Alphaproteobacteria bacterium]|nr:MAG: hypothetical protein H6850_01815 [Alphaproteobacteria bacterium]